MPGWLTWLKPKLKKKAASDAIAQALARLKIRHFDQDILEEMAIEDLRQNFGRKQHGLLRFNVELLMRNVIWQIAEYIQAGRPPDFVKKRGNIRSLWYHIKSRIQRCEELRGSYYDAMIEQLAQMVRAGLLAYADFDFRDINQQHRFIGRENPHVIVFAEKDSFFTLMETVTTTYGCTTFTMGGAPSLMSCNYLVTEMQETGIDLGQEFFCFSIVDFDPRGEDAAHDFIQNLKDSGLRNLHRFRQYDGEYERLDLMQPANLASADFLVGGIEYTLPLSEQQSKLGRSWAERTGGVAGDGSGRSGLESDEFSGERILELLASAVTPHLRVSVEDVGRYSVQVQGRYHFQKWLEGAGVDWHSLTDQQLADLAGKALADLRSNPVGT